MKIETLKLNGTIHPNSCILKVTPCYVKPKLFITTTYNKPKKEF